MQRQVRHEARAVEIAVLADLEVAGRPFRFESDQVVKVGAVAHHGTKRHFVVAAQGAPDSARQPRLDEDRRAFVVPTRRETARRAQVRVDHRLRVFGVRQHLALKDPAEHAIGVRRLLGRDHVPQLVTHDPIETLVGGACLVDVFERFDAECQIVVGDGRRSRIAVVVEVLQENRHVLVGRVPDEAMVEPDRVLEAAREVREDVRMLRVVVDHSHARRF